MGRKRRPQKAPAPSTGSYTQTEKCNVFFTSFYSLQLSLTPEDQASFLASLQEHLPVTFRISPVYPGHERLLATLHSPESLSALIGEAQIAPVPWFPNHLTWEVQTDRRTLKRDASFKPFHTFLKQASDSGLITRQELVSMLPVLALDVHPGQHVLDMCAAPGSKTSQCIEQLGNEGLILANDADPNRARMLIHQLRRANTSLVAVVNHQAQFFPRIGGKQSPFLFDRIICDVPCTGDGAIRKYPTKWSTWSEKDAMAIHPVQVDILFRALILCKENGLVAYSTCSLNPIEDEAVVSAALTRFKDDIELVDLVDRFSIICPGLRVRPGLPTWKVLIRAEEGFREVSPSEAEEMAIKATCFPQESNDLLTRTVRIMPQDQNTGGFYIALFRKIGKTDPSDTQVSYSKGPKRPDFRQIAEDSEDRTELQACYGLPRSFPFPQFLFLSAEKRSKIFFISSALSSLLSSDIENRLALFSLGVRVFSRNKDKGSAAICRFRICQEGMPFLSDLITARRIDCGDRDFLRKLLFKRILPLEEAGELVPILEGIVGYAVIRFTCLRFPEEVVILKHNTGRISSMASDEHTAGLILVHELA